AGYQGAGTVEFLLDETGAFYFLELNARLQVEHPVTELVTGRDLVADQLRIASGEPLHLQQARVRLTGHAVEARLYAEDPWASFVPATGTVHRLTWPVGAGIRVDAGVGGGDRVGTRYDPLLAKIVAHGRNRREALERLTHALQTTSVLGVTTNRGFLRWLLSLPEVVDGDARTETIPNRWHPDEAPLPDAAWLAGAAALANALGSSPSGQRSRAARSAAASGSPSRLVGFRLNAPRLLRLRSGGEDRLVPVDPSAADGINWVALPPGTDRPGAEPPGIDPPGAEPAGTGHPDADLPHTDRGPFGADRQAAAGSVVLDLDGRAIEVALSPPPRVDAADDARDEPAAGTTVIVAPMPGTVISVRVRPGQSVEAREVLLVLEAMKMENAVSAPADGRVRRVLVNPGKSVQRGEPLIELS
ncbi:MAG: hypothetical protein M3301_05620, partial [Chloroflexota bacterium]|nr:hypothetical protein [Chloroflexota bacterium]